MCMLYNIFENPIITAESVLKNKCSLIFNDKFIYRKAKVKAMGNEINKTHKNVVGYMIRETYVITYNEYIYNDCRDGIELEKIVQSSLKPKEYDNSGSWCGMSGFLSRII